MLSCLISKYPIVLLEDIKQQNAPNGLPHEFMNLNDHCILEILERLPLADLCSMAETCVRVKQLCELIFRLKYRHFNMELLARDNNKIRIKQAQNLFSNFGHLIQSLNVSRKLFAFDLPLRNPFSGQRRLLKLIQNHCLSSLETLTLGHFWLDPETIIESMPIFKRIQTLNHYRLSCFCPESKKFYHFANVLPSLFQASGFTHQLPLMVQLV